MAVLHVLVFVILACILQANGAAWKAPACPSGLATGNAVQLSAACTEDGVEVTWHASRSEVDLVQIEYICRNASADQNPDEESDMHLLVPFNVVISNRKPIPVSRESAIECTISGCYEGWFFDVYAISSITWTCEAPLKEPELVDHGSPFRHLDSISVEVPVPSSTKTLPQTSSIQNTATVSRSGSVYAPAPSQTTTTVSVEPWLITSMIPTISTIPASARSVTKRSSSTSPYIVLSTPSTDLSSSPPPTAIVASSNSQLVFIPLTAVVILLAISGVFLLIVAVLFAPKWRRWNSQVQLVSAANSSYLKPTVLVLKTDLESTSQMQFENKNSFTIKPQDYV